MEAADKYDLFYNRIFLDPAVRGEYQVGFFDLLSAHGSLMDYRDDDLKLM